MVKISESADRTVLIADNQPGFRRVIAETLGAGRYKIIEAQDGEEVIRQARSQRPDLILVNTAVQNPDVCGVVHVLRAHEQTASIPIILLTDNHGDDLTECSADQAVSAVDRCIAKPFSPVELVETVERLLPAASTRA